MARENEHILEDDATHPIRSVRIIDTVTKLNGGGEYLGIVIASPLQGDKRSITRLNAKLKMYVDEFETERFLNVKRLADKNRMMIYVSIHPSSAPEAFRLLEEARPLIEKKGIKFVVDTDV